MNSLVVAVSSSALSWSLSVGDSALVLSVSSVAGDSSTVLPGLLVINDSSSSMLESSVGKDGKMLLRVWICGLPWIFIRALSL